MAIKVLKQTFLKTKTKKNLKAGDVDLRGVNVYSSVNHKLSHRNMPQGESLI